MLEEFRVIAGCERRHRIDWFDEPATHELAPNPIDLRFGQQSILRLQPIGQRQSRVIDCKRIGLAGDFRCSWLFCSWVDDLAVRILLHHGLRHRLGKDCSEAVKIVLGPTIQRVIMTLRAGELDS